MPVSFNTIGFDLVIHPSITSANALKGKAIAISRIGSVSDVAARELLKSLGLKAIDEVGLRQIGGTPERIAAFSQGAVAGFINPPGSIHLVGKAVPHKILISMADLQKPPAFPWVCAATTKSFLAKRRDAVKRFVIALTEAHYFKSDKDGTQRSSPSTMLRLMRRTLKMPIVHRQNPGASTLRHTRRNESATGTGAQRQSSQQGYAR